MELDIEKVKKLREAIRLSEIEQQEKNIPRVFGHYVSRKRSSTAVGLTMNNEDLIRLGTLSNEHGINKAKFIRYLIYEFFKKWDGDPII